MKDASSFKSHVSKLYHAKKRVRPRCQVDIARSRHRKMVVNFHGLTDAARGDSFVDQFYAHVVVACSSRMTAIESHTSVYGWLRQHFPSDVELVPVYVTRVGASTSSSILLNGSTKYKTFKISKSISLNSYCIKNYLWVLPFQL